LYSSIFAGVALVGAAWWLWGSGTPKPALADADRDQAGTALAAHGDATPNGDDADRTARDEAITPRIEMPAPRVALAPPPSPEDTTTSTAGPAGEEAPPPTASASPEPGPQAATPPTVSHPHDSEIEGPPPKVDGSGNEAVARWIREYEAGRRIEARNALNRMLKQSLDPAEQSVLRRHLARIADEMVFSGRRTQGDPLVETYIVQSGDVLVRIGRKFDVPAEAIMLINHTDHRIREGQQLVVPRGPFHVQISKSAFRLDVYLGDTYLRSYPVGLGAEGGTPEGEWVVKERLEHPTYYPPPSAKDKRVIRPHDPTNPLGTRWIALEGKKGSALGKTGYGIHGTIDPASIGKSESLGCIRMHNTDVEQLFGFVQPGATTVTVAR